MGLTIYGVDTSLWQSSNQAYPPVIHFDCSLAARKGAQFGYMKVTTGTFKVDPEWQYTYECWRLHNKKRGFYHWITNEDGNLQANKFLGAIGLKKGELPDAMDVEVPCYAKDVWKFASSLRDRTGKYPICYTSPYAWTKVIDGWTLVGLRLVRYKRLTESKI